jgi:uncharacterized membrane protein
MSEANANARLEAFCDAVFAIAMTLLVIDIKLPVGEHIGGTTEFLHALQGLLPAAFAFVLSFGIIFITWVNHHATLKLVHKSSAAFIYANGLLLLTVVFMPFPTSLLGEFLWSESRAPSVVLYDALLAVQAIGWILVTGAALKHHLTNDDSAASTIRENKRSGYFAFALYSLLAIAAWWFPLAVAVVTAASWMFWLVLGLRMKHA